MEVSRRQFLGGSIVSAVALALPFPSIASAIYIDPDWRKLVPFQHFGNQRVGKLHYLDYAFNREESGFKILSLSPYSQLISDDEFIYDESTIAQAVKDVVMSFPKPYLKHDKNDPNYTVFEVRANCNMIAKDTRRGAGNTTMYDSWYYRGNNQMDSPIIVVSRKISWKTEYAIWKSSRFDDYGFHLDAPVLPTTGHLHTGVYEYNIHTMIEDDGFIRHVPVSHLQQQYGVM